MEAAVITFLMSLLLVAVATEPAMAGNFYQDVDITWGGSNAAILDGGDLLTLSLNKYSGAGFQSKNQFLFGRFDVRMKLPAGNTAGTVTTFYLSSTGPAHDEIDFEFLGNVTGQPYILHTNLYVRGKGDREQQFYLWFDPTADFHIYTAQWNSGHVVWYVDGTPIREFKKSTAAAAAVPFPDSQAMRVYASIWDGEDWATRGGRDKTDWSAAPFTASYRSFVPSGCTSGSAAACGSANAGPWMAPAALDQASQARMAAVQQKYMVYNYCADVGRFPQGLPPECTANQNRKN